MDSKDAIAILQRNEPALRSRGIRRAAIFGSVARGDNRPDSDLDILVEFEPGAEGSIYEYMRLKAYIADLNYSTPSMRQELDRVQDDGGAPFGGAHQVWIVSGKGGAVPDHRAATSPWRQLLRYRRKRQDPRGGRIKRLGASAARPILTSLSRGVDTVEGFARPVASLQSGQPSADRECR